MERQLWLRVVFQRWVTPEDAELLRLASLN